jgi:hypothetical protein
MFLSLLPVFLFLSYFFLLCFGGTESYYLAKDGLEFQSLWPQPPICWDYSHTQPYPATSLTLSLKLFIVVLLWDLAHQTLNMSIKGHDFSLAHSL